MLAFVALFGFALVLALNQRGRVLPSPTPELRSALARAGCRLTTPENEGRDHVDVETAVKYRSFPPASGPHLRETARWGVHDRAVDPRLLVHNLEHGGIVVYHRAGSAPTPVLAWQRRDPTGVIVAPLARLASPVALTAWRRVLVCPRFDRAVFDRFRDVFRGKGPERVSLR